MFLIPGVTAEPLDARFASPAAYGDLGAAFWIPALIVPLLIVTHVYIFNRLWVETQAAKVTA